MAVTPHLTSTVISGSQNCSSACGVSFSTCGTCVCVCEETVWRTSFFNLGSLRTNTPVIIIQNPLQNMLHFYQDNALIQQLFDCMKDYFVQRCERSSHNPSQSNISLWKRSLIKVKAENQRMFVKRCLFCKTTPEMSNTMFL